MKATYIIPCLLSLNALIKVFYPAFQHIISVGVGHASKSVCSGVFLSNRTADSVQENELKGITAFLVVPKVNFTDQSVTSTFLGVSREISEALNLRIGTAKYLGPSFGCSLTMKTFKKDREYYDFDFMKGLIQHDLLSLASDDVDVSSADLNCANDSESSDISETCKVNSDESKIVPIPDHLNMDCFASILDSEFSEEAFLLNQTRAIVISHDSHRIAERYQTSHLAITADTKLLGWSMTKSVFSAIVGVAIQQGLLTLDTPAKLHHLKSEQREQLIEKNNGNAITFRHLLQMYDVLGFVEDYGPMKDVVFMLYGTYETVKFASSRAASSDPHRSPVDGWYYSSAVSNLLSAELRGLFANDVEYWEFPHKYLFGKINAPSFAIEMDAQGLFVASSFGYATARDWTKMGELFLNKGQYNGEQIIPRHFVDFAITSHPRAGRHYGGHFWLNPGDISEDTVSDGLLQLEHPIRGKNGWLREALPSDAYFMSGHDGQSVFVIPSLKLVITRLGFTKDADESKRKYTHALLESLMTCVSTS